MYYLSECVFTLANEVFLEDFDSHIYLDSHPSQNQIPHVCEICTLEEKQTLNKQAENNILIRQIN